MQALTFPIEAQFEGERGRCLQDALTEQQNTLVQVSFRLMSRNGCHDCEERGALQTV
jgi:hypothetical protein